MHIGLTKPISNPFRYFNSSPEIIRLVVMMDIRLPLSSRNVKGLLFGRGIDIGHETVRFFQARNTAGAASVSRWPNSGRALRHRR